MAPWVDIACAVWIHTVFATLDTALPINNQVPPVARALEPYSYQFARNTYTTTAATDLTYNISQAPAWLGLNAESQTLLGIPATQDVGPFEFVLSVTDGLEVITSQVSLIVVEDTAPIFTGNISAALDATGSLSGPSTLTLGPGASFDIRVGREFFQSRGELYFYATSADRSPLPSWVSFDATTVTFTGATPQPATAPRDYPITLFASQVAGFAEVGITFAIIIANHKLLFASVSYDFTFTSVANVSADIGQYLTLDAQPAPFDLITSVGGEWPTWIALNPATLTLTGSAPPGTISETVTISVQDVYGDEASVVVGLSFVVTTVTSHSHTHTELIPKPSEISMPGSTSSSLDRPGQSKVSGDYSTATSGATVVADPGENRSRRLSGGEIAAIIVLPVVFLIAVFSCCVCLAMRRKRRRLESTGEDGSGSHVRPAHNSNREQQHQSIRTGCLPSAGLGIRAAQDTDPIDTGGEMLENVSGKPERLPTSRFAAMPATVQNGRHGQVYDTGAPVQSLRGRGTELPTEGRVTSEMASMRRRAPGNSALFSTNLMPNLSHTEPLLRGAGHGSRLSGSSNSGYMLPSKIHADRTSYDDAGDIGAARRPENVRQRLSTIRQVSRTASNKSTISSMGGTFDEMRQGFISRRASNPSRPLFSAGAVGVEFRNSSMPENETLGRQSRDRVSMGRTTFRRASRRLQDGFREGFPRAASTHSSSSEWRDIDDESRYSLEGNKQSAPSPEENANESSHVQPLQIRKRSPSASHMAAVAGRSETRTEWRDTSRASERTESSAFI